MCVPCKAALYANASSHPFGRQAAPGVLRARQGPLGAHSHSGEALPQMQSIWFIHTAITPTSHYQPHLHVVVQLPVQLGLGDLHHG